MPRELQAHPIADLFPMMTGASYRELRESIRESGLRDPVITFDGKILDGRNRYKACVELGIEPELVEWAGAGSPWVFVWDENAVRRHLDEGTKCAICLLMKRGDAEWQAAQEKRRERQKCEAGKSRAEKAERDANGRVQPAGGPKDPPAGGDTRSDGTPKSRERDDLAKIAQVSPTTAKRVLALESKAPELFNQVAKGQKSATQAYGEYRKREKVAVVKNVAAMPDGKFHVIAIDPPWRYEKHGTDDTYRAQNPYPDMSHAEIEALPISSIAQDSCVLWLWTTSTFMRDAYRLLDAWEFKEKSLLTWAKDRMGTGAWLRGQTEHCILAVRGRPVVTLSNQTTLLHGPMREHSRKPDEFYELVESLCPGSKLEMFARQARPGWQAWGAETELFGPDAPITTAEAERQGGAPDCGTRAVHQKPLRTRSGRVDGVLVPADDAAELYAIAGYTRREAREIDTNIMTPYSVAVTSLVEADWERLSRRIDMKRSERRERREPA